MEFGGVVQGTMSRAQFTKWLCKEATSSCKRKPPPLPKDRPAGPAFEAADPEDLKMQKMMAQMKVSVPACPFGPMARGGHQATPAPLEARLLYVQCQEEEGGELFWPYMGG